MHHVRSDTYLIQLNTYLIAATIVHLTRASDWCICIDMIWLRSEWFLGLGLHLSCCNPQLWVQVQQLNERADTGFKMR
jgi:hypothetical protein